MSEKHCGSCGGSGRKPPPEWASNHEWAAAEMPLCTACDGNGATEDDDTDITCTGDLDCPCAVCKTAWARDAEVIFGATHKVTNSCPACVGGRLCINGNH